MKYYILTNIEILEKINNLKYVPYAGLQNAYEDDNLKMAATSEVLYNAYLNWIHNDIPSIHYVLKSDSYAGRLLFDTVTLDKFIVLGEDEIKRGISDWQRNK